MAVMIRWQRQDAAPVIECDVCHEEIQDVHLAMYAFDQALAKDGARSPVYFVHKGACWEAVNRKVERIGDIELSALLDFLRHNLNVDMNQSAHAAHALGGWEGCDLYKEV